MISPEQWKMFLPIACQWVRQQEDRILKDGVALDEDQQIDAWLVGVKEIRKVRLLKVKKFPVPELPGSNELIERSGLFSNRIIGTTYRYGIYIHADYWNHRRLIVHELAHTMQYERMGSLEAFVAEYVRECLMLGYPNGPLEKEARLMESKICD
jgi:hypothetical protein